MDLKDFLRDIKDEESYIIERKLSELIRKNYHFKNLNEKNKEIVLELIMKYKEKLRTGVGLSQYMINKDIYDLHQHRIEKDLTLVDLKKIREIAESFKE